MSNLLASLGIVCLCCDHLNAPGSPHCASCSAALSDAPGSVKVASAEPRPPIVKASEPRASARPAASDLLKKQPSPVQPAASSATHFGLSVLSGNRRGERFKLPGLIVIGRRRGNLIFADDPFLSPQHATLLVKNGRLFLRDDSSASGVFASISGPELISSGTFFCAGQHLFRYLGPLASASPPSSGVLIYGAPLPQGQHAYAVEEVLVGARSGRIAVSTTQVLSIGKASCDFSFPNDKDLAARHCELTLASQGAILRDLSGGLMTFVRLPSGVERALNTGDQVRVGQEVLRIERVD